MTRAAGKSWQHRHMRGDDGGDKALPQTSNKGSITQHSNLKVGGRTSGGTATADDGGSG
jgi:hypothetical protein